MATPSVHTPPVAIDDRASRAGLRTVAVFEAFKGLLVILLLIALLAVHNRIEDYAEDLVYHLHIGFDRHFTKSLLRAASRLNDSRPWTLAIAAAVYATVRFIEAWGLWNRRVWAEWFALLSGALYLPWEMSKVAERASWTHIFLLATNIAVVVYMLHIRIRASRPCEKSGAGVPH